MFENNRFLEKAIFTLNDASLEDLRYNLIKERSDITELINLITIEQSNRERAIK